MYGAKIMGESPMSVGSTRGAGSVAVEVLARAGVRRFYTVPGESFLEVLDAVEEHPALSLVSTRHESGASFMAEADAKLSGVPAVAMATRGVRRSTASRITPAIISRSVFDTAMIEPNRYEVSPRLDPPLFMLISTSAVAKPPDIRIAIDSSL